MNHLAKKNMFACDNKRGETNVNKGNTNYWRMSTNINKQWHKILVCEASYNLELAKTFAAVSAKTVFIKQNNILSIKQTKKKLFLVMNNIFKNFGYFFIINLILLLVLTSRTCHFIFYDELSSLWTVNKTIFCLFWFLYTIYGQQIVQYFVFCFTLHQLRTSNSTVFFLFCFLSPLLCYF